MPDSLKRDFAILQKYAGSYKDENVFGFVNEFIFAQGYQGFIDVIGIYFTNSFQTGLGIVTDRLTPFPPTFKFPTSDLAKKKRLLKHFGCVGINVKLKLRDPSLFRNQGFKI